MKFLSSIEQWRLKSAVAAALWQTVESAFLLKKDELACTVYSSQRSLCLVAIANGGVRTGDVNCSKILVGMEIKLRKAP